MQYSRQLSIICFVLIANSAQAEFSLSTQVKSYLQEKERITMCVDPDWLPYEKINQQGKHIGIAADFINIFAQMLETPIELVPTNSWNESLEYSRSRRCDILSFLNESEERKQFLNFTDPYLTAATVIIARDDVVYIDGLDALNDKTLCIVKGYIYEELIRKQYPSINIIVTDSVDEALKLVSDGTIYATIGSLFILLRHIQELGLSNLKIAGHTKFKNEFKIGVRNDEPLLLEALQSAVQEVDPIKSNEILQRWNTVRIEHGFDYVMLWRVIAGVAIILIFLWYRNLTTAVFNQKLAAVNEELKEKNIALEQISRLDHLTQIYNRVEIDSDLEKEAHRYNRYQSPFSIILFDIDYFKEINDRLGHQIGDQVLCQLTDRIKPNLREDDVFGRWGGEEFIVLCPETNGAGALQLAEKLRASIDELPFVDNVKVTASFGVAEMSDVVNDVGKLIKHADEALYKVKSTGRNGVELD